MGVVLGDTCMQHNNASNKASTYSAVPLRSQIHLLDDLCIHMLTAAHEKDFACLSCVS